MRPPAAFSCLVEPSGSPQLMGIAIELALFSALTARRQVHGAPLAPWEGLSRVEGWSIGLQRSFGLLDLRGRVDEAWSALRTSTGNQPALARAALTLARVACVARAELWFLCDLPNRARHIVAEPSDPEVAELSRLHSLLPVASFDAFARVRFHPTFGEGTRRLGGADGDLLADDTLFEIKNRPRAQPSAEDLRQLVAYAALANRFGVDSEPGTSVQQIGLLFPRAGSLFTMPLRRFITATDEELLAQALLSLAGSARRAG
jgi:hypothetical protein